MNYIKGKTEALIIFEGRNSYACRVGLLVEAQGLIKFTNDQGVVNFLRSTDQYKNLGSQVTVTGSMGPALNIRLASMGSVFCKIRTKIIKTLL